MSTIRIWNIDGRRENMVVPSEVKKVCDLSNCVYLNTGLAPETVNMSELNNKLTESGLEISYSEELEEFLQSVGIDTQVTACSDYVEPENVVVWEESTNQFFDLAGFDSYPCYEWWNGSDWVQDILFDGDETEVEIDDDTETDLDKLNGSDWQTGSTGRHEKCYKVLKVNGEAAECTYLLYASSQWQSEYSTGKLMTAQELREHLEELGRDVEEYAIF